MVILALRSFGKTQLRENVALRIVEEGYKVGVETDPTEDSRVRLAKFREQRVRVHKRVCGGREGNRVRVFPFIGRKGSVLER